MVPERVDQIEIDCDKSTFGHKVKVVLPNKVDLIAPKSSAFTHLESDRDAKSSLQSPTKRLASIL